MIASSIQKNKSAERKFISAFALMLFFAACHLSPVPVFASVPQTMSYQGILKDASSNYLTGTYAMVFKIYSAATGGTALWTETQSTVSVSSGKFSVTLGSVTAINLAFNADYWLGITVGTDAEMTPRIKLTSVGYVFQSENVVNSFTQSQHDALSHKNIEGVKDNTVLIGKTNFKLDAYSVAVANTMGDMVVDTFSDASGISAASSTNYTWRGSSNYDVLATTTDGNDSYTKLLAHMNGTNGSTSFSDSSSSAKTVTANGNAQVSTAQSKFGGSSAAFDGTGDYLSVADSTDWDFGSGDFTVDFWVRFNTVSNTFLFSHGVSGSNPHIALEYNSGNLNVWITGAGIAVQQAWSPSAGTWYHLAIARSGSTLRLFADGTILQSPGNSSNISGGSTDFTIGAKYDGSGSLNGWIDEFRVSNTARWTANFTPPTAAYGITSGTATVVSVAYSEPVAPTEAIVIADETLNGGTITYSVSRDNGTTWTACTKETLCNISGQPSGTQLKWKAVITDAAELNAISVAI